MDLRIIFVGFFVILCSLVKSEKAKERNSRVRIKLNIPKIVKKHTHTRIVTQHHYHKVPNAPVLPAAEIALESTSSLWNSNPNKKPWDSQNNNDWSLMQAALNPNMDFQQFQNIKNKLKKSNFNLEDYENMKESFKTGDFQNPSTENKMSLEDMLNRFEAEHQIKEEQAIEASDANLYAMHKLAELNADLLENKRQKQIMETIKPPEITASDFFTPNLPKKHKQNKFRPSSYHPYEDPADDIYPKVHHKDNNNYQRYPKLQNIRHPKQTHYIKEGNFAEPTSYSNNDWLPNEQQNSYRNWNENGHESNRFSTLDSTSTDDNDMDEIMNFSSFDNSFHENKSNIPKINQQKKRQQRPQSSVYVAKVYH